MPVNIIPMLLTNLKLVGANGYKTKGTNSRKGYEENKCYTKRRLKYIMQNTRAQQSFMNSMPVSATCVTNNR